MRQFDVVVGNPPYQDSSHVEKKNTLWRKFLDLGLHTLTKEGGYLAFITPSSWAGSPKLLTKHFLPNNLIALNKDECKRYFPTVGSTFSYYVIQRAPYQHKTWVKNVQLDKSVSVSTIDLTEVLHGAFPRDLSTISVSIVKKVLDPQRPKLGVINACTHHNVKRDRFEKKKGGKFKYPIQNTPTSVYWYDTPHPDQGIIKVAIPTSTYFKRMMLTTNGVTQGMCYFNVPDGSDPEIVLANTNNKLFDYVNECFRYANWNSVPLLRDLPAIPFDKHLTDQNIYDYFGLTKEEARHIEDTVSWR